MTSSFGKSLGNAWKATKQKASDTKKSFDERVKMEGLLTQARISLEHYLGNKLIKKEQRMSREVLQKAKGIALITEAKGGFIVGIKGGSGVIMIRKSNFEIKKRFKKKKAAKWSAPCAVGTGGVSVGFLAGAAKVDHIIILSSQEQIDMFLSNGQLQIKGNANATAAKWGRNADAGIGVGSNKNSASGKQAIAPIFTYSFGNKGIYGGVSLDGEVLAVRKDCNEAFYGNTVNNKDILTGVVKMPKKNKDYIALINLLNDYCTGRDDDDDGDDAKTNDDGMDFPVQPQQNSKGKVKKGKGKGNNNKYQIPQNQYVENNATNQAAFQSMAENKEVQNAGKSAMKDKNVQKAAFNAYRSGGNDQNANKDLAKSLGKNKAVQGAAVSVAKDKKVQKAAMQSAKKNANKKNFSKAKKMMLPKPGAKSDDFV